MGIKIPNPKKEAEKAVESIIRPAVRELEGKKTWLLDKMQEEAKSKSEYWIGNTRHWAETYANRAKDKVKGEIDEIVDDAEKGLTEKLPALIEDAARELAEEASEKSIKEALDTAADVIEFMAPTRYTLIFGIELALVVQGEVTVSASFPNPVAKLTEIRKWAKNPPEGRAEIIECIKDFGPESLAAEFKISGNGGAVEWDGEDKYDRIDAFLEKHGVD